MRRNAASISSKHFPREISLCSNLVFVHICKIRKFSIMFSTSFPANRVTPWSLRCAYPSSSLGVPQQPFVTYIFALPQSMPDPTVFFPFFLKVHGPHIPRSNTRQFFCPSFLTCRDASICLAFFLGWKQLQPICYQHNVINSLMFRTQLNHSDRDKKANTLFFLLRHSFKYKVHHAKLLEN